MWTIKHAGWAAGIRCRPYTPQLASPLCQPLKSPLRRSLPRSAARGEVWSTGWSCTATQALYFNHLYDPISMVRDNEVKAAMAEQGVVCHTFNSDVLYEPWEVLSPAGQPLTSFADFWERCAGGRAREWQHPTKQRTSEAVLPDELFWSELD